MKSFFLANKFYLHSIIIIALCFIFGSFSIAQEFRQQEKISQQQVEADTLKVKGSVDVQNLSDVVYPKRQSNFNQQGDNKETTFEKKAIPIGDMKLINTNTPTPNPIQPK